MIFISFHLKADMRLPINDQKQSRFDLSPFSRNSA